MKQLQQAHDDNNVYPRYGIASRSKNETIGYSGR